MPATVRVGDLGGEDVHGSIDAVCASVGPALIPQAHSGHLVLEAGSRMTGLLPEMVRSFPERLTVIFSHCWSAGFFPLLGRVAGEPAGPRAAPSGGGGTWKPQQPRGALRSEHGHSSARRSAPPGGAQLRVARFLEDSETLAGSGICSDSRAVTHDVSGLKLRSARHGALGWQVLFGPHRGKSWHHREGAGRVCTDSLHMQIHVEEH